MYQDRLGTYVTETRNLSVFHAAGRWGSRSLPLSPRSSCTRDTSTLAWTKRLRSQRGMPRRGILGVCGNAIIRIYSCGKTILSPTQARNNHPKFKRRFCRSEITMRNLFQMSSGLRFSGFDSPRAEWEQGRPDHALMYSEAIDCFEVRNAPPFVSCATRCFCQDRLGTNVRKTRPKKGAVPFHATVGCHAAARAPTRYCRTLSQLRSALSWLPRPPGVPREGTRFFLVFLVETLKR